MIVTYIHETSGTGRNLKQGMFTKSLACGNYGKNHGDPPDGTADGDAWLQQLLRMKLFLPGSAAI